MVQKTPKLYPSAPLLVSNNDLEQRLEKKLNELNSFNKAVNNIKEMIIYLRDKNCKSKMKYKIHKKLTTIMKSFDTFFIIAITSGSITLSVPRIGLIAQLSAATAYGLSIGIKKIFEIDMLKYNKYKRQHEKDQQTIEFFVKLFRKNL